MAAKTSIDSSPRLRGQEVLIELVVDGALSDAFTAVAAFSDSLKFAKSEDGFLGEPTNRHDFIYNGVDGSFEMHLQNSRWMTFQQVLKDIAQRNTPDTVINIVRTDYYANGNTPTRTYQDVKFGGQPTAVSSRGDFVKVSFDFSCDDYNDQLN